MWVCVGGDILVYVVYWGSKKAFDSQSQVLLERRTFLYLWRSGDLTELLTQRTGEILTALNSVRSQDLVLDCND